MWMGNRFMKDMLSKQYLHMQQFENEKLRTIKKPDDASFKDIKKGWCLCLLMRCFY
jgi:hypothetical protein